ncbi:hypothetical protein GFC29_292 [Anoxybacillus sp. B7M1]|jgi:Protein of unknown function (DUF3397)|uniref:DUF3397 domain-containing protein n=1 Tax=Anoxybacteroides rupiense TaxID=311460 RepID=A0ABD5IRQ5_9BACL|nr:MULTISPECIES: DUF3397 domain-containing protein [Anoxybacillus]ANB57942.1 hypothetical protein GFC28_1335 [Anoxybacillus sp. B2M1]ANB65673.1 hypothetical protein GFC29_292 [Anoxybacillus sp. B7M1]KXG10448.1 hypothetical protein AT864_01039 [Anoxybacillus sp. P3H1B]MBB3906268.1 hypothetical protein [Anoxybacillus rupiensis]MBS2770748.1 DUF3397 domain-containing protein [Anoxybacillus rupiensis]
MGNLVAHIAAAFVTMPLLAFFVVYMVTRKLTKKKKKSFYTAINISTIFFIIAVHFLIQAIWGKSYWWPMVILLIIINILFAVGYWQKKGDLHIATVFRLFWRFSFLLFFFAYFGLLGYGILVRIVNNI